MGEVRFPVARLAAHLAGRNVKPLPPMTHYHHHLQQEQQQQQQEQVLSQVKSPAPIVHVSLEAMSAGAEDKHLVERRLVRLQMCRCNWFIMSVYRCISLFFMLINVFV